MSIRELGKVLGNPLARVKTTPEAVQPSKTLSENNYIRELVECGGVLNLGSSASGGLTQAVPLSLNECAVLFPQVTTGNYQMRKLSFSDAGLTNLSLVSGDIVGRGYTSSSGYVFLATGTSNQFRIINSLNETAIFTLPVSGTLTTGQSYTSVFNIRDLNRNENTVGFAFCVDHNGNYALLRGVVVSDLTNLAIFIVNPEGVLISSHLLGTTAFTTGSYSASIFSIGNSLVVGLISDQTSNGSVRAQSFSLSNNYTIITATTPSQTLALGGTPSRLFIFCSNGTLLLGVFLPDGSNTYFNYSYDIDLTGNVINRASAAFLNLGVSVEKSNFISTSDYISSGSFMSFPPQSQGNSFFIGNSSANRSSCSVFRFMATQLKTGENSFGMSMIASVVPSSAFALNSTQQRLFSIGGGFWILVGLSSTANSNLAQLYKEI